MRRSAAASSGIKIDAALSRAPDVIERDPERAGIAGGIWPVFLGRIEPSAIRSSDIPDPPLCISIGAGTQSSS
jgi:hypothetical protein